MVNSAKKSNPQFHAGIRWRDVQVNFGIDMLREQKRIKMHSTLMHLRSSDQTPNISRDTLGLAFSFPWKTYRVVKEQSTVTPELAYSRRVERDSHLATRDTQDTLNTQIQGENVDLLQGTRTQDTRHLGHTRLSKQDIAGDATTSEKTLQYIEPHSSRVV